MNYRVVCIGRLSGRKDLIATHPAYPLCQQTCRKLEIIMTLFLSGIQYYRAMFNFTDSQFYEHADVFVGIGAEELLNLWWPEGQHISNAILDIWASSVFLHTL